MKLIYALTLLLAEAVWANSPAPRPPFTGKPTKPASLTAKTPIDIAALNRITQQAGKRYCEEMRSSRGEAFHLGRVLESDAGIELRREFGFSEKLCDSAWHYVGYGPSDGLGNTTEQALGGFFALLYATYDAYRFMLAPTLQLRMHAIQFNRLFDELSNQRKDLLNTLRDFTQSRDPEHQRIFESSREFIDWIGKLNNFYQSTAKCCNTSTRGLSGPTPSLSLPPKPQSLPSKGFDRLEKDLPGLKTIGKKYCTQMASLTIALTSSKSSLKAEDLQNMEEESRLSKKLCDKTQNFIGYQRKDGLVNDNEERAAFSVALQDATTGAAALAMQAMQDGGIKALGLNQLVEASRILPDWGYLISFTFHHPQKDHDEVNERIYRDFIAWIQSMNLWYRISKSSL